MKRFGILIWLMIILISTYAIASEIPWYQRIIGTSNDDIPRFQGVVTYTNCSGNLSCSLIYYKGEDLEHIVNCSTNQSCDEIYYKGDNLEHTVDTDTNCTNNLSCSLIYYKGENLEHIVNCSDNQSCDELYYKGDNLGHIVNCSNNLSCIEIIYKGEYPNLDTDSTDDATDTNCSNNLSCAELIYKAEYPYLDENHANDLILVTAFSGDVVGHYDTIDVLDDTLNLHFDNLTNVPSDIYFNCTRNLSCNNIFYKGEYPNFDTNKSDDLINGSPIATDEIRGYTGEVKIYGIDIEYENLSWILNDDNNWSDIETYDNSVYDITNGWIEANRTTVDFGAYYPMDEGSGDNVFDNSGNNDATRRNFSNGWVTGVYDNALYLDGVDDIIMAPDSATFGGTGSFSVTFWANVTDFDEIGDMGAVFAGEDNKWGFETKQTEEFNFFIWGGDGSSVTSDADLVDNVWSHVAGTYNGTHMCLYIDGNLEGCAEREDRLENTKGFTMGDNTNAPLSTRTFYGMLDEVYYFKDKALTSAEITQIMNNEYETGEYDTDWNVTSVVNDVEAISGSATVFNKISVNANIPSDTNLSIYVNTSSDNSTWGSWILINDSIISETIYTLPIINQKRYGQFKIHSITTNISATPVITNVVFYTDATEEISAKGISIGWDGTNVIVNATSSDTGIVIENITLKDGKLTSPNDIIANYSNHGVTIHPYGSGVNIDPLTANDSIYMGKDTELLYFQLYSGKFYGTDIYSTPVTGDRDLLIDEDGLIGYVVSSKKVKKNIKDTSNTDWIYDLQIRDFDYKDKKYGTNKTGMIAEEVELINPKLVSYKRNKTYVCYQDIPNDPVCNLTYITTNEPETVNYGSPILISTMIKEMQILQERITYLESLLNKSKPK